MKHWSLIPALLLVVCGSAQAGVIVYTGYHDDDSPALSVPNPWFGSPNTLFFGSAGDLAAATAADPDLSAVRVQNILPVPITINNVSITAGNLFTRAGLVAPVVLPSGGNAIFAAGDGSDSGLTNQNVSFTINGIAFSAPDATPPAAPSGVLFGLSPAVQPGGFETVPWTQIADVLEPVPEPASLTLLAIGAAGMATAVRRRRNQTAGTAAP